jgi:hypothetical protein
MSIGSSILNLHRKFLIQKKRNFMKERIFPAKEERLLNFCPSQEVFTRRNVDFQSRMNNALLINQIKSELSFTDLSACDKYIAQVESGSFPVYWFLSKSLQILGLREVITDPNYQDKYNLIIDQMIESVRALYNVTPFHTRGVGISDLVDQNLLVTNFSLYYGKVEIGHIELIESWEAWMEEVA